MSILTYFGRLHEKTVSYVSGHNYTNGDVVLAIDKLVRKMHGNGSGVSVWDGYACLYLDAIDLANGASNTDKFNQIKLNLIDPRDLDAAYRQVGINSPSVNREGISFNGTNQAIDTKFVPSTNGLVSLNEITFGVYCNSTSNKAAATEYGSTSGGAAWLQSAPRWSGAGGGNYACLNDGGVLVNSAGANIDAFICHNRTTSNQIRQYRNGLLSYSPTINSNSRSTRSAYRGGMQNSVGSLVYASDRRQISCFIGKQSDTNLLIGKQIINEFQGDYELAIGLTTGTRKRY